jgi:ferric-dicitrate binding protein FerR (iron transport regulator)
MKGTENEHSEQERDLLEELFRNVSSRERPSREEEQAVRASLHAQWLKMTRRRRIRRLAFALASAASVVLAVVVGLNLLQAPKPAGFVIELARVEKAVGRVESTPVTADAGPLTTNTVLGAGQQVVTSTNSRLAIRWLSGESVRLDENTVIRLHSGNEIELSSGQIYIDTDQADLNSQLVIKTPNGVVRHLGTRYLTAVRGDGISISVRDGRVQLQSTGLEAEAGAGERMILDASGAYELETISTYGPMWQWTEAVAPAFPSDGRSLAEFLGWVARESGRELIYDSTEAEQLARQTELRGQVDMEPMRALGVMTQTTDLESRVNAGSIIIKLR